MTVLVCLWCGKAVDPSVKRYRIQEEYPRTTVGYLCRGCYRTAASVGRHLAGIKS